MGNDIVSPPLGFRVQEGKSGIDMTHAALTPLIGPEFDEFLCASVGEDRNGTGLSVLSALARLKVDPWQEAASLARMPRAAAVLRLTALIEELPDERAGVIPAKTSAADLVALLPRANNFNVGSSDGVLASTGLWKTQILMALSAFAIMILIVFAISALLSPAPGAGPNPLAPRVNDATTVMPRP
jgi:hypothetical protein